jgi:putative cell wall-binding protein
VAASRLARVVVVALVTAGLAVTDVPVGPPPAEAADPAAIRLEPDTTHPGAGFVVEGCGFSGTVDILWNDVVVGTAPAASNGCVHAAATVPSSATDGNFPVIASGGGRATAEMLVTTEQYVVAVPDVIPVGGGTRLVGCGWGGASQLAVAWDDREPTTVPVRGGCVDQGLAAPAGISAGNHVLVATGPDNSAGDEVVVVPADTTERERGVLARASVTPPTLDLDDPTSRLALVGVPLSDPTGDPATDALRFLAEWRGVLGLQDPAGELFLRHSATAVWRDLVFGQQFHGIPVYGAEVWVGLSDGAVQGVHGRWLAGAPTRSASPALPAVQAIAAAGGALRVSQPEVLVPPTLVWFDPAVAVGVPSPGYLPRLAWQVVLSVNGHPAPVVLIDAADGAVLYVEPTELDAAWDVKDAQNLPYFFCGAMLPSIASNDPNDDVHRADQAMNATWSFYKSRFGRKGATNDGYDRLIVNVAFSDGPNAKWLSSCETMAFSPGAVADDIVGHEFTHGVTGSGSMLKYRNESGALNESMSDVFGVLITCAGKPVCDADDWDIGEDTALWAPGLRDLRDPETFGQPTQYKGANWQPTTSDPKPSNDQGGVHTNSGVPNQVAALLIAGGVHNGRTITAVQRTKVETLYYLLTTALLTSGSSMSQAAAIARDAAHKFTYGGELELHLTGVWFPYEWDVPKGYAGFTATDLCQVRNAWAAVGLQVGQGDADCDGTPDASEGSDADSDNVADAVDSCPFVPNQWSQNADQDADGLGDVCDPDRDGDSVENHLDNCPLATNAGQADVDGDGKGDACDDSDLDGVMDATDNCRTTKNPDQLDSDHDGLGNACDSNDDNDAYQDGSDNCPTVPNNSQSDTDGDGVGDACDNCPSTSNPSQKNSDGANDGGDACDPDDDNDGIADGADNCPTTHNPSQADLDQNGVGFACDTNEQKALLGPAGQVLIPAGGGVLPIDGCLSCGPVVYDDYLSHVLEIEASSPNVVVNVVSSGGQLLASGGGATSLQLTFPPLPAAGFSTPAAVSGGARTATAITGGSFDGYHLQVVPTGGDPVQISTAATTVAASPQLVERYGGADRYETAANIAAAVPSGGTVYVATGENFPDALTGGPAAVLDRAPILLVTRDSVPQAVATELDRRAPARIVVLGGTAAVSDAVVGALRAWAPTVRRFGPDRYATAAEISRASFPDQAPTVYLATGEKFPDALAGGARAARERAPVLLTASGSLPPVTADELRRLAPSRVVVLGGTAAVSDAVLATVRDLTGVTPERVSGIDRYATAAAIAATYEPGVATALATTGLKFPDALAGVPLAAAASSPILLVADRVQPDVEERLLAMAPRRITVLGGTAAVSQAVADSLQELARP